VIVKNNKGEFCVYKKAADGGPEGETLGCHPTKEDALKQIAAIWANEAAEVSLTREFIAQFCPSCAEKMAELGVVSLRIKDWRDMPDQLLEGLCAAVPGDSFTSCMAKDFGDFEAELGSKEGFCAWLHFMCTGGEWPSQDAIEEHPERRVVDMTVRHFRAYVQRQNEQLPPEAPIRFVASTEGVKRDGLDLKAEDWEISNYMRNPIISFAHDLTRPPIGRGQVSFQGRDMIVDIVFDRGDPFAADIERKIREGFINAVSVGWQDLPNGKRDLVDIAVVPVPSDPQALAISREFEPEERWSKSTKWRNRNDLQQAISCIERVLKRMEREPVAQVDNDEDMERMLVDLNKRLEKILEV